MICVRWLLYLNTIANILKNNITDLSKVILNCRKLTDENMALLELARQELNKLLNQ
jgi:hypothetical protein